MTHSHAPCFPPNLEASKAWDREQAEKRRKPPHPAPVVPCRGAVDAEVPRSAGLIRGVAVKAGWETLTTYAKGTRVGAKGEPLAGMAESIAVRCLRGDERAVGVWLRVELPGERRNAAKWGYETGYAWRVGERASVPERLDFEPLKARLRSVS